MKNKTDTLVILSPGFPANEADTTCIPPQQLFVKTLKEICPRLNVIVIAFQYPFFADQYRWHGIKVIAIGGKNKGYFYRLITWGKAWAVLNKLNKRYKIIGLLSFWFGECAFVGNSYATKSKLGHYSWLLGQDAKKGNKYFKWIDVRGDSLIALSDFLAREVQKTYQITPANIIPVGVDPRMFPSATTKREIDVLAAGSLIPLKSYHLFIEAVAFVKEHLPDVKAVLCGMGPEMAALQALAVSFNVAGNILFAGEVPHNKILELMQRSKVFLHPSNYEGYGAVLAEALYAGNHVISFCKPMNKNYKHHHVIKNKGQMNDELLAILKDSERSHDRVLTHSIQETAKSMIGLIAGNHVFCYGADLSCNSFKRQV